MIDLTRERAAMDFKNIIVTSWHNTLNFIGPVLLMTLVYTLVSFFSFGILLPVTTAGYVHSILLAVRENRTPKVGDLFSQMGLFLPLFLFSVVAAVLIAGGLSLLILPGLVIAVLIAFAAFYLLPLMTDKGLGLVDALKTSWHITTKAPVTDHLIIALIYVVINSLGASFPFAFLLTTPFATFILVAAYRENAESTPGADSFVPQPPPPMPEKSRKLAEEPDNEEKIA